MPAPNLPQLQYLPVDDLHFDPRNPRLPTSIDARDDVAVIRWMLQDATIIELMGSIGQNGYFPGEPLLAVEDESESGFIIVEGNRRLTATKLLSNPELATVRMKAVQNAASGALHKPVELPVLVYPSRGEILNYLGYRHITGIKEWDPLPKARYLYDLYQHSDAASHEEKLKALARTIGSRSDYVERLLNGLTVFNEILEHSFFGIEGMNEGLIKFSVLTTALNYQNIATFLGIEGSGPVDANDINVDHLKELTAWMFEKVEQGATRLGESRNLRELSAVVASPLALQAFRERTSLEDAYKMTSGPDNAYRSAVAEARKRLDFAWNNMLDPDSVLESDRQVMAEIQRTARNIGVVLRGENSDEAGPR